MDKIGRWLATLPIRVESVGEKMIARTILHVEDDDADAFFMRMAFEKAEAPHRLVLVTDGMQAIDYLSGEGQYADREKYPPPWLVLLDLNLPIKSGFEVLDWVRSQAALKGLRVVIVTSSGHQSDRDRARALGVIDYVVKPSLPSRLAEVIRSSVDRWLAESPTGTRSENPINFNKGNEHT